jgi:hypothetical protein
LSPGKNTMEEWKFSWRNDPEPDTTPIQRGPDKWWKIGSKKLENRKQRKIYNRQGCMQIADMQTVDTQTAGMQTADMQTVDMQTADTQKHMK